ncbi:MAG: double-strand break repair helicase AddA [Pseudomonadota bacterium]
MSQVHPLHGNQRSAVDPAETVWLSASAGTGKTQVLAARVLRLLLQEDVRPSQILCLTFTKAGAAEMAVRVGEVLANWVRMPDIVLAGELEAIGARYDPPSLARARTLFAAVLDCPGGGLRIDTIHAFSQWLLAGFPEEAGLSPGTRAMEDRDRALLLRDVLANLLISSEDKGDQRLLDALAMLTLRMAPDDVERYLLRCAEARAAWEGAGAWQQGDLRGPVNRLLGLAEDASETDLQALCNDSAWDVQSLRRCMEINAAWATKTGLGAAQTIGDWLAASTTDRLAGLDDLWKVFFTQKGELKSTTHQEKIDPSYGDYATRVGHCLAAVRERRALLELAAWLAPALTLGRAFAHQWQAAKQREGLIDFDDQIREAARLLTNSDLADWIRYKLDRRFDHILIDEAQDTNEAQWQIINALTGDFFSGEGQHADKLRTLFVVGDYKQAIFRFQGTSPENFERAKQRVKQVMAGALGNLDSLRDGRDLRELQDLGLGKSFRTAASILAFVDMAIAHIGHENFGLNQVPEPHEGEPRPGLVSLWQPISLRDDEAEDDPAAFDDDGRDSEAEEGGETWLSRPDRLLADKIARQIKAWVDPQGPGFPLIKGEHRRATAGDVMVLVRKRKELAGLIVARLYAAGVKVAGVDRLRLGAPLAVKDLVAALRFAAQPFDDLNLAALLVSPLIGWSQDALLAHGYRDRGVALWSHLRASRDSGVALAVGQLLALLARADYDPPQMLLHWLLVGPWQGRARLIARLGREANDPIDELVNAAHAYAMSDTASLVGFLHWFDAGDGELKREAEGAGDQVRVMTVHGSKGLQAPIVILADAADNPEKGSGSALELTDPRAEALGDAIHTPKIPLPLLRKDEKLGRIAEADAKAKREEQHEHWRLLYVAMTRAEEALFITGALGSRELMPATGSWYAQLDAAMPGAIVDDPLWGGRKDFGSLPPPPLGQSASDAAKAAVPMPLWLQTPLAPEPRPPRPLAPSSLGEDESADPPFAVGSSSNSARRGTLIHTLLERLPELPDDQREGAAMRWLARSGADLSVAAHADIVQSVLAVLRRPDWASLFSSNALVEVPIAALVGEQVVAGTIDRLVVAPDCIRLIDYKSTRRPPEVLEQVPTAVLRQMAAYAAALEVTYPGRRVEAALLYTQAPILIAIPPEIIVLHKPQLSTPQ